MSAQAHQPNVKFTVVTPVPTAYSRDVQDRYVRQGQIQATQVALGLQAVGVPPDRITIGLRGDAGVATNDVEVYAQ
jgi:hypothetical protein